MKLLELRNKYQKEIDAATHKMNTLYHHGMGRRKTEFISGELKEFILDKKASIEIIDAFVADFDTLKKQIYYLYIL